MSRQRDLYDIDRIVVHCSATPNGRYVTIEEIDRWHAERGFHRNQAIRARHNVHLRAIGYHFVIYTDGTIQSGRCLDETGAHAAGWNATSIGICLIGTDRFTVYQWHALSRMTQTLLDIVTPNIYVLGHRDLPNVHKLCPGFDVADWLQRGMAPINDHLLLN